MMKRLKEAELGAATHSDERLKGPRHLSAVTPYLVLYFLDVSSVRVSGSEYG